MHRSDSTTPTDALPSEFPRASGVRDSDTSDVFLDLSTNGGPQGHSTPHPSSGSSQNTTTSLGSRNTNASQLTTISSIDEGNIGSNQSIFDHIQRLNQESHADLSDIGAMGDNVAGEQESSADVSDVPHCVSRVALLTDEGAPNDGTSSAV